MDAAFNGVLTCLRLLLSHACECILHRNADLMVHCNIVLPVCLGVHDPQAPDVERVIDAVTQLCW